MSLIPSSIAVISAPIIDRDQQDLIINILNQAKSLALPAISKFYVGAMAIGISGQAYLGFNLEFTEQPVSQTVHAEQSAVVLAKHHGEKTLSHLVVSAMPCGYCRQFLMELGDPDLKIIVVKPDIWIETSLKELLPYPFMLANNQNGLLSCTYVDLQVDSCNQESELIDIALQAACLAYVPYTKSFSGVAIKTADEHVFSGGNIESAAFNPTISALQAALIHMISCGKKYEDISEVVLLEVKNAQISSIDQDYALVKKLAPESFIYIAHALLINDKNI